MIHVAKITVLISAMAAITACGGSDSGGNGEQASASVSPASTMVSNEGEVVVGAVFLGGLRSGNVAPFSSASTKSMYKECQTSIVNLLIPMVVRRVVKELVHESQMKSVSMTRTGNVAQVVFKNEVVALSGGSVTFDGVVDYEIKTENQFHMVGSVTAKHDKVGVSITQKEKTYSESVSGALSISMSADLSYQLENGGQIAEMKIDGIVELSGKDVIVSGDVSGSMHNMKTHSHVVAEIVGSKVKDLTSDCGGYVAIEVNGEQAVCGILSSCDGCEQPK